MIFRSQLTLSSCSASFFTVTPSDVLISDTVFCINKNARVNDTETIGNTCIYYTATNNIINNHYTCSLITVYLNRGLNTVIMINNNNNNYT